MTNKYRLLHKNDIETQIKALHMYQIYKRQEGTLQGWNTTAGRMLALPLPVPVPNQLSIPGTPCGPRSPVRSDP